MKFPPCIKPLRCIPVILLAALILVGLMGCSPIVRPEQAQHNSELILNNQISVGQSFLARFDGLNGISLHLSPGENSDGEISLSIWDRAGKSNLLQSVSIPISNADQGGYFKFDFPDLRDSSNQSYYLELSYAGAGEVRVGAGPGDSYQQGAAYINNEPANKQISFRLVYASLPLIIGLVFELLKWGGYIIIGIFLFVVPGWALLLWLWPGWQNISWVERLALASGTSLALYPVILLWFNVIGFNLGLLYAWLPPITGSIYILLKQLSHYRHARKHPGDTDNQNEVKIDQLSYRERVQKLIKTNLPEGLLFLLLSLMFIVRYWNIRLLEVPLWGDSYQHTMIAQLLVDNNGLPSNWLPYVPYESLTVHFGFPLSAALFNWLVGIPNTTAVIYTGQMLNIIAALSLYPITVKFSGGNRWAGLGAVMFAGLLSPTPAFYTNWGRYAQLAGQAILPVALWFFMEAIGAVRANPGDPAEINHENSSTFPEVRNYSTITRRIIISGIVIAGMTLHYFRMPFYFGTFVLAWLIVFGVKDWRFDLRQWGYAVIRLAVMIGFGILLFLPWGLQLSGGLLASAVQAGVSNTSPLQIVIQDYQAWRDFSLYVPGIVFLLIVIASVVSLIVKRQVFLTLFLWFFFLIALRAGQLIRLPGANMIQNFAVLIALYIPISILLGWLFGTFSEFIIQRQQNLGQLITAGVVIILGLWGFLDQRNIVDAERFSLVTRPDLYAMDWIHENTPQDSRILVEGFRIYDGTSAVGADAGWWIPLLAGRQNTMPPQYALLSENPMTPGYSNSIVALVAALEENPLDSESGIDILCDNGISHIYIGQDQGMVGYGATQLFSPQILAKSPAYLPIYQQDRVHVYEFDRQFCAE